MNKFRGRAFESELSNKFQPGMPVRIKNTADHTLNGEYLPNGVTGLVQKVENGKVFVAYRVPGDGIKKDEKNTSIIFPFNPDQVEEITS